MSEPTYTPTGWINNTAPPIDADNLNKIESGVQAATQRAVASVRYDAGQTLTGTQQAQAQANMSAVSRAQVTAPPAAAVVTQGLYARLAPTPDSGSGIAVLCADPNNTGVLWAYGLGSGKIGYTTDHGATFVPVLTAPNGGVSGMTPCQITITSGVVGGDFMFLVLNSNAPNQGQVWRSPAPNATGSNIVFTQIFGYDTTTNLINGPGGTAGGSVGVGENLRNSSFAITPDGSHAYILPYAYGAATIGVASRSDGVMSAGSSMLALPTSQAFQGWEHGNTVTVTGAGASGGNLTAKIAVIYSANQVRLEAPCQTSVSGATVTFTAPASTGNTADLIGGPIIRVCANPCAASASSVVWSAGKQWINARHGHAVRVIDGNVWVSLGDYPYPTSDDGDPPTTHVGLHCSTSLAATTFNQVTSAKSPYPWDCINIYPVTINGTNCIVGESDSVGSCGPLLIPSRAGTGITPPRLLHRSIPPNVCTLRCLTIDPANNNIYYYATSEGGTIGQVDAIVMAAAPYTVPIVLEELPSPSTMGVVYDGIIDGPYVWFGANRITREKIIGQ